MGLEDKFEDYFPSRADWERIALEQFPDPHQGHKGWEYRKMVVRTFLDEEPVPRTRQRGKQYRSPHRARLDRTWTKVADKVDRDAATVRAVVLGMYHGDTDGHQYLPDRLFEDLRAIERQLNESD